MSANEGAGKEGPGSERDAAAAQPVEEAEKNLSRHSTKDSSPPVEEQWRSNVEADEEPKGDKR